MVKLHLTKPKSAGDCDGDSEVSKRWISLLNELGSLVWSLMTAAGRSEARLWLCNTIGGLESLTSGQQRDIFIKLLRANPTQRGFETQLLQMVFSKRPQMAGAIIAKRCHVLEKFFQGSSWRISDWFANFADGAGLEHKKGAKALFQFAFVNRDICWEELEWKGKHGQSPAVVATKPHYLLDLDVQRTVENFLEHVPEFWSSREFAESLKDGEILQTDPKFFLDFFTELMFKDDSRDVWEMVSEFLMKEPFSSLCQHLLIILEEKKLLTFLELLHRYLKPGSDFKNSSCSWLELMLSERCSSDWSIDQLLLVNGIVNHGRQLLRLVRDEDSQDSQEERLKIKEIASQVCKISNNANTLAPLLKECSKKKTREGIKLLGVQSFVIHYTLSEACKTSEAWESLFSDNGIAFRRSNKYVLLNVDGLLEESDSELGGGGGLMKRKKHKKRKEKRKKRRRDIDDDDELLEFNGSSDGISREATAVSWLLSTDDFSASWTTVDIPEHLSRCCFSTWLKFASSNLA
ncbi:hypothetical protein LINPERPRIM_LOCUS40604 [Linum perenne]